MNVKLLQVKINPDTPVRAMQTVQILRAVSCVNVEKALLEMVSLAEVITCYTVLKIFNLQYGLLENFILNFSSKIFRY